MSLNCPRLALLSLLTALALSPAAQAAESSFSDVSSDAWYVGSVAYVQ